MAALDESIALHQVNRGLEDDCKHSAADAPNLHFEKTPFADSQAAMSVELLKRWFLFESCQAKCPVCIVAYRRRISSERFFQDVSCQ